ncbi:hypothetical protein [Rubellicoccus peritrichatus]|uniref:PEP-CTERM protein-sorting domain-containing protein n=1 Tax=Rubellicoccus peritrichatus TaxID=3080537 RepID=A0AAQ3QUH6_9BACT|nr:hypothetical protein [Puniceicoccus sp. CR14]WOO39945.1 hypothetical protein RZN69_15065 [Puniceicoccus sp. CR14]
MKLRHLLAVALIGLALKTNAAITFSGGSGTNLTMTVTQDIAIPLNASLTGSEIGIVLKDVYNSDQGTVVSSTSGYGSLGSTAFSIALQGGGNNDGNNYHTFGTYGFSTGVISPRDLVLFVNLSSSNGQSGDTLNISAGSVTQFFVNITSPDNISDSTIIQAVLNIGSFPGGSDPFTIASVTVPEPATYALGFGTFALSIVGLRRWRKAKAENTQA